MRVVGVANLTPGLIVGRPVVDDSGKILLNSGVALTSDYIAALSSKGFARIYVAEADAEINVEGDEDLNPATRAAAIQSLRAAFKAIEHAVPNLREKSFEDLSKACASGSMRALMAEGGPFDTVQLTATKILSEVLTRSALAGLTSIKAANAKLYNHSVDVCVVAVMVARAIGLDDTRIRQLATGCLLHDVGMTFVDWNANEVRRVRQHTLLGYELLRNNPNPDLMAPHVALEHHEWQDGSGEPRGLVGSNILERDRKGTGPVPTLIGEIAAVANVYDNLLTGSVTQPPMTPDAVVQAIYGAGGTHLNRAIVSAFIRLVPVYPLGTEVIVRSERHHNFTGIVSRINPTRLDRPVVILFRDNLGSPIHPIQIDLIDEKDVRIRCKLS